MKQKLLLLSAVFFGVLAFILTFQQINSERRKIQATMQEVALLELKRDIAENEIITEDAILVKKYQRARSQLSNSREVTADQKNLIIGRKALFPINRGSVLQWNDLQTTMAAGREGANSVSSMSISAYSSRWGSKIFHSSLASVFCPSETMMLNSTRITYTKSEKERATAKSS